MKVDGLLLHNAQVLTLNPAQPTAGAVLALGDRIAAVVSDREVGGLAPRGVEAIDCRGCTLLPGFVDAHCHLLAAAGMLTGVDCGPSNVKSIEGLKAALRQAARTTPPGGWVRGYGYDDLALSEKRHPDRWDLDDAVADLPVRVDHRSGHASALNSKALELAGIGRDTVDPADGVIQREPESGEPTGLLWEMAGFLRQRLGPNRNPAERAEGLGRLDRKLLSHGITSAQDAGPSNDLRRWRYFQAIKEEGRLTGRVTMMAGQPHLEELVAAGLQWGTGDDGLRLGHAKIVLTMTTGTLLPGEKDFARMVADAHRRGFPVAVHAVEQEAVTAAARVLAEHPLVGDRIEHCSECPPEVMRLLRESGVRVVTQPGFVYWKGDDYLERVEPELLPWLYPVADWHQAGIPLAFGSDAPVIDFNPWPGIAAAVTGMTAGGVPLNGPAADGRAGGMPLADALWAYTVGGAEAEGIAKDKGSIAPGKLADLTLLKGNVNDGDGIELAGMETARTIVGGKVVWRHGE